jgi:thiamine pyrophosphate-dependent acetolactate synthase large subunit-like protein
MSRTVAQAIAEVLERRGVSQVFGLISSALNPPGDAVRRGTIEWVGVRHGRA